MGEIRKLYSAKCKAGQKYKKRMGNFERITTVEKN